VSVPYRVRLQIALREWTAFTSNAKLCGFVVLSYMNDEGEAWPSLKSLERGTATARTTVLRGLAELEAAGFLEKVRGRRHSNTYVPQLPTELDRVVDEWLAADRRRAGQLPLPLDGRGLGLVFTGTGFHHATPGVAPRYPRGSTMKSELDRELVSEIGTGLPVENNEQDLPDPLADLVSDLADADEGTLHVFRSNFGGLSAWDVEHAHDALRRRRKNRRRRQLRSEAAFAFDALRRRKEEAA
jgi:Helix-turn-helix domain